MGCSPKPHYGLLSPNRQFHLSRKHQRNTTFKPLLGALGAQSRSTEGENYTRIELSTVNVSKIIKEFLQRTERKKNPNNLGMAYSSLQLGISISVKLRCFCSPGFPHLRDPELLKALR